MSTTRSTARHSSLSIWTLHAFAGVPGPPSESYLRPGFVDTMHTTTTRSSREPATLSHLVTLQRLGGINMPSQFFLSLCPPASLEYYVTSRPHRSRVHIICQLHITVILRPSTLRNGKRNSTCLIGKLFEFVPWGRFCTPKNPKALCKILSRGYGGLAMNRNEVTVLRWKSLRGPPIGTWCLGLYPVATHQCAA